MYLIAQRLECKSSNRNEFGIYSGLDLLTDAWYKDHAFVANWRKVKETNLVKGKKIEKEMEIEGRDEY
jgi:hypothetical protein